MRVCWVTFGAPIRKNDGSMTSGIASLRYRVLSPIGEMRQETFEHKLIAILPETPASVREAALRTDVLIFSKSFLSSNEALAHKAKSLGVTVIFDVCDNHYQHPQFGPHYRNMSNLADQIICNTEEMAKIAQAYSSTAPVVIDDPFEGPKGAATFFPGRDLKLLWFGHPTNLDSLQSSLHDLIEYSLRRKISLTVLTQPGIALKDAFDEINAKVGTHFLLTPKAWSLDAQWRELAACDAVIIPSLQNASKHVKSANRMIEALWAGRPVVAHPMPAYMSFDKWTPVWPVLSEGIERLIANQTRVPSLISEAQDHIERRYAPVVLAKSWEHVIKSTRCGSVAVR